MKREEKERVVADLKERFSRSRMTIVTDFQGLNVEAINALRNELRQAGADYRVVKNTLVKLAARGHAVEKLESCFEGPCAVALSYDDPVAPAKVIMEFSKKNQHLRVKGGLLNDRVLTGEDVEALAQLPGREELLARLLSCMNAVPGNFVRLLHNVLQKFLGTLAAIRDQKESV